MTDVEPDTRTCPYCAKSLVPGAPFCRACGRDLRTGEQAMRPKGAVTPGLTRVGEVARTKGSPPWTLLGLGVALAVIGVLLSSGATIGLSLVTAGCLVGIAARMLQAER